jgi:hypothetical protein
MCTFPLQQYSISEMIFPNSLSIPLP